MIIINCIKLSNHKTWDIAVKILFIVTDITHGIIVHKMLVFIKWNTDFVDIYFEYMGIGI